MEEGFRELGMVPEATYMLGFAPPGAADGKFHKLKVSLTAAKGYSIEARLGYTCSARRALIEPRHGSNGLRHYHGPACLFHLGTMARSIRHHDDRAPSISAISTSNRTRIAGRRK